MTISQPQPKKTLVFIDSGVSNYQSLVDGLGDDTPWVLLDADQDGVLQMQAALAAYSAVDGNKLDSIQVISHGSMGTLVLGTAVVNQDNLGLYASAWQDIGRALTATGDILLYGCNVGQGDAGAAFVTALAQATQADVAASTDNTGAASLGGNWVLETSLGSVEAVALIGNISEVGFADLLGVNTAATFSHQWGYTKIHSTESKRASSVTSLDANGDFQIDLVFVNEDSKTISVLLGNGNGTFSPKVDYATNFNPRSVISLDANADGKMDLVVANWGGNDISVFLGNGDGTFAAKVDYVTGNGPTSVTSLDANGDGKVDLAVTTQITNSVSILLGNGDGTFAVKDVVSTGSFPVSIASLDANADGKMDLVVANYSSETVSVLLGNGNGTFASKVDYPTSSKPTSVISFDTDSDGKMDLVVGNSYSDTVSVLLSNGTGTFAAKVDYVTSNGVTSVTSLDANGDGKLDIMGVGIMGGWLLLGNGDGTLAAKADYPGVVGLSVTSLDANADGKMDLVVAGYSDVSVLLFHVGGNDAAVTEQASWSFFRDHPVLLNSGIQILDAELAASGNYNGATLTLARHASPNAQDVFTAQSGGTLTTLISGSYFSVDNVTIGRVTTNAAGTLTLAFNANGTQALVNKAMQQIAYANTSDAPSPSVQIDWVFNDGNTGAQGTGGAMGVTGSTTVTITPTNDAPVLVTPVPTQTVAANTAFSYTVPAGSLMDPDLETLSYSLTMSDGTGIPPWLMFNVSTRTLSGTPSTADVGSFDLILTAKDAANASVSSIFTLTTVTASVPTYTLAPSATSVNEGTNLTYTLNTTNVPAGTVLSYTLSGVSAADVVGGALTGSVTVASTGVTTFTVALVADSLTEGAETLVAKVSSASMAVLATASGVVVNDTSLSATVTPPNPVTSSHTNVYISATTPQAFTIADSGMSLFGGSSREVITLNAGVNTVKLNQNVDRVNLPGASSSFTFKQAGNQLVVYDSLGANVIVTLPLQGDADGTQIGFGNGVFNAKLSSGVMSLGGAVVNPSAPTGVNPATLTSTLEPTPSSSSSASAYLQPNDVITIANSGVKVFGSSGAEALTLTSATNGIVFDQNMDRINLPGSHSNYKFLQTGNQINVYDALGTTLIARGPVQSDSDGTLLSFDNGVGSVFISGGVMTLGGSVVSTSTPSAITSSVFTNSGLVAVSGSGSGSAAGGDVTYAIAMGNYAYSISGFGPGDKIVSPAGVTPTLENSSYTDGLVTIQSASAGQTVQITLTGLTNAQDLALNTVLDLNAVFGVGTLT